MNSASPVNLLLIEDDASDVWLVQSALDSACPGEFSVATAHSVEEAMPRLSEQAFDVALLDLSLPGSSELEALENLRHGAPRLPVVILTGYDNEVLALAAMQHGAQDYLVKEQTSGHLIKRALRYAIQRKHFEDNLTVLANYDPLTGLVNRSLFTGRLEMALARTRRSGGSVAVFFLDLNRFKQVNDTLGHDTGDLLLKEVAARLKGALRECDTVARFGGDEFAILAEGVLEPRACAIVAQKIVDTIDRPFIIDGQEASIGVSIGITIGQAESTLEALMENADAAMYRAKANPKSNYQFYTEHMHQETLERLQLEYDMTQAIRTAQGLCLYYQPKIDIASGQLAGAEALLRWHHPVRGMLMPAEFLKLMPPSLALDLDRWVLETICRDIKCWQAAGLPPVRVSLHISACHLENGVLNNALLAVLKNTDIEARHLAVEIEEAAMLHHGTDDFATLLRIRETGIEVHLDNFGDDISSLKLLTRCPLDAIKIDRRLIRCSAERNRQTALMRALIDFGHELGIKIVAEGVETPQQQQALSRMECDQIQGVIVSKPLPAQDFFTWMGRRQRLS